MGGKDKYDIEDNKDVEIWEEDFRDILDIGRKMPEKDMAVDLLPGLERLKDRYSSVAERAGVYFPRIVDGSRIELERNFAGLNVLYIGNERFQAYLSRFGTKKAYFKELLFSLNIGDGWYNNKGITITMDRLEWAEGRAFPLLELKKDTSKMGGLHRYGRKCRLLQDIKDLRYFGCRAELSQRLQKKGWFHIGSANLSENLRRQLDRASERTPSEKYAQRPMLKHMGKDAGNL